MDFVSLENPALRFEALGGSGAPAAAGDAAALRAARLAALEKAELRTPFMQILCLLCSVRHVTTDMFLFFLLSPIFESPQLT